MFFVSSGLFLGWSLGANHAVNVFGTAVVSKMVKFRTAALIAGIFVIVGSVFGGAGTTKTLNDLGAINAIAGSFAVALAVAISVTWMTRAQLPVSTSQAVIGAIIGWNIFTGSPTDYNSLSRILFSWVASPIIACLFAFLLFKLLKKTVLTWRIHLLELDNYTRIGLVVIGALASYSLGANNIANVMGMFISAPLFENSTIFSTFTISGVQQLFLLGGLSIAVGIFTYGYNVMKTVGKDLYEISPITGLVVVLAEFMVLTLFTSQGLESLLLRYNLPSVPLVPLSTTQAFIGAIIGVGLAKDPLSINFKVFGKIATGWVVAPVSASLITFLSLFFIQNVFEQKVIHLIPYEISPSVVQELESHQIPTHKIKELVGQRFFNKKVFANVLKDSNHYSNEQIVMIFQLSIIDSFRIDSSLIQQDSVRTLFSPEQQDQFKSMHGLSFQRRLDFENTVFKDRVGWVFTGNKLQDKLIAELRLKAEDTFRVRNTKGREEPGR